MNGFEKRASLIKEKIIKTTLELMRTEDPKRIRIADISKKANVSQVTIYNYFGSKEALLHEAFKSYVDKVVRDFEQFAAEEHTLKEKIEYIIFLGKESYGALPPGLIKELLIEDHELTRYIEEQYRDKTIPWAVKFIEDGKRSGEIAEDVSVETVLAFIQIYMNQYEAILEMAQKSGDTNAFLESMINMFFYGICGKK